MNAIIITLYTEALLLFVLLVITALNAKHEEAKHRAEEFGGHALTSPRHAF